MENVGYAALGIIPSFDGFQGHLERGTSGAMIAAGASSGRKYGDSAGRSMMTTFGRYGRQAGLLAGAGIAVAGAAIFKVGKDSIALASDLNESLNAVNVSYGEQAAGVKRLGREAAESLGLSNIEFNSLAVRFSSFAQTIAGGEGPKVVGTLDDLTTRASDFASVMNLEVNEAARLFQSGLAGETEPLRQYGIDLSAAAVGSHAVATGIADSAREMTEAQKVQARYSLLMKQTNKTQGDFANTSGELANQQRILGARWDDARSKLGVALLPIMKDAVGFLNREGIPAFERFADWVTSDGMDGINDLVADLRPLANEVGPAVASVLGDIRDALSAAAPYAADLVGAFNDMPDWAKKGIAIGGVSALAAGKLGLIGGRGGVGGDGSGLLGMFSKASPMPVYVTNPGFGGVPGGTPGKPGVGTPTPVPLGPGGKPLGTLPGWAPFIPVGLGSEHATGEGLNPITTLPGGFPATDEGVRDMVEYRAELESTADLFKTLPTKLQTDVILHGAPESRREAKELAREYDLTAEQRTTLFRTSGIPLSSRQVADLLGLYRDAEKPRRGSVYVETGDSEARLLRILNLANSINRLGALSVATGGSDLPQPSPRTKTGGGTRKRGTTINVHLDGKKVGEVFDERIGTYEDLADERIRAGADG